MKGADKFCMISLWSFWRQIKDSLLVLKVGSCEHITNDIPTFSPRKRNLEIGPSERLLPVLGTKNRVLKIGSCERAFTLEIKSVSDLVHFFFCRTLKCPRAVMHKNKREIRCRQPARPVRNFLRFFCAKQNALLLMHLRGFGLQFTIFLLGCKSLRSPLGKTGVRICAVATSVFLSYPPPPCTCYCM